MRKENVSILAFCAVIVFALVAQLALAEFLAERDDAGTSDNSLESNSVDGDSDSGDVRERLECTEEFYPVAVITDNVTGVQYLFVGNNAHEGGLTVLVGADGKPVIAEEAGTSNNRSESDSVDGDSDFSDARGRFKGTEDLQRVAVITDNVTGAQYLYVAAKWGISGGLVVLVDADGNPLIAEEAAMAPSNQAAGER